MWGFFCAKEPESFSTEYPNFGLHKVLQIDHAYQNFVKDPVPHTVWITFYKTYYINDYLCNLKIKSYEKIYIISVRDGKLR